VLIGIAFWVALLPGVLYAQPPGQPPAPGVDVPAFVDGQVLIQFRPTATEADKSEARGFVNAQRSRLLRTAAAGELELATLGPGVPVSVAVDVLSRHPAVSIAEPNWVYTRQETPTDAFYAFGLLWGMYGDTTIPANPFGSQAGEAWAAGHVGSTSVVVAMLDQGIDPTHLELSANMWVNPGETAGNGVDDDLNGYVDDVHGWDFVHDDNSIYESLEEDYHGTHVAGTIGATEGGNVVGVNWHVKMISAKFIGPDGGTTADVIEALDYLVDLKARHNLNLVATNNSYGGGGYSQAFHEAIIRSAKAGILFVAAAGNGNMAGIGQNNDQKAHYPSNYDARVGTNNEPPAAYDSVIAVAAIDASGAKAGFSNYGATTVDLGAPGVGIYSTAPDQNLLALNGTSMATPHVTGAAALYASMNPTATAAEIRDAILASAEATPTGSLGGSTATGGRLNIGFFVSGPPDDEGDPPAAPTGLTATADSSSQITLLWTDNSTTETAFDVESCIGTGCTDFAWIGATGANEAGAVHLGLIADTLYRYRVRATDGALVSNDSNVAEASTLPAPPGEGEPPTAPSNLTATADSSSQVTLLWADNSTNETAFHVESCNGIGCSNFVEIGTTAANEPGAVHLDLDADTLHRYRVRASNGTLFSAYSNVAEATTLTPPGAGVEVTGIDPSSVSQNAGVVEFTITGAGFAGGASVVFSNGSGPSPRVQTVTVDGPTQVRATVEIRSGGPRRERVWDVEVRNSDGSTGVGVGLLHIVP
jgi:hypothetical protein